MRLSDYLSEDNFVYSRRDAVVVGVAAAIVVVFLGLGFGLASAAPPASSEGTLPWTHDGAVVPSEDWERSGYAEAVEILKETPVIDGHNDFAWTLRGTVQNDLRKVDFASLLNAESPFGENPSSHTDLPRLRAGRVGGQFWSAYADCSTQFKDATQVFLEQIDVVKRLVDDYPEDLQFATSAQEVEEAMTRGKIASLIGVESGHAIDSRLGVLRTLYQLGARYMTLTHSCNTPWADSSTSEDHPSAFDHDGLTDFGREVVAEMNRLGMMVDLAHVSAATMRDTLDIASAPIVFSHSSARAVTDNARNVPDDVLRRVARNGGVVMVNFYSCFVSADCNATVDDVVNHVNHVRDIAGVDHVGIGGDYNGVETMPVGLEDVSKYPNLFAALLTDEDRPWSREELGKLASGNILRVMRQVEEVRDVLSSKDPYQDWIPIGDLSYSQTRCMSDAQERRKEAAMGSKPPYKL